MKRIFFLVLLMGFTVWGYSQTITSVTIIYGDFYYFPPADILPSMFDRGEVCGRDTITTTDSRLIYRLKQAIEHLPKYCDKGYIDTRGKISFSFDKGENWVAYFDMFCLLQKYGEKTFRLTKEIRFAMNAIAARNKKRPVFDKESTNVKY